MNAEITTEVIDGCAFPIFTLVESKPIPGAREFINFMRSEIFNGNQHIQEFSMVNGLNKKYTGQYRFVTCTPTVIQKLKSFGMLENAELIDKAISDPAKFIANLIMKKSNKGRNWLMLHVSKRG
jgi:hypothetical protein